MSATSASRTVLGSDGRLLFVTRAARMFSYGFLSVVLVLYLAGLGLGEGRIGLLLTLTLVGDTLISLGITLYADRLGRKHMLMLGAALMVLAGIPFALSGDFLVLLLAATIGVISPSGNEVGPFRSRAWRPCPAIACWSWPTPQRGGSWRPCSRWMPSPGDS